MDLQNEMKNFPIIFKFCVSESTHREKNEGFIAISQLLFYSYLRCKEILKMSNHNWSSIVKSIQISEIQVLGTDINWPLVQHAFGCVPIDLRLGKSDPNIYIFL